MNRGAAKALLAVALVIVTTSPAITQGAEFINLGWIVAMCLTPLLLLFTNCRVRIPRVDIPAIAFAAAVLIIPTLFHPSSFRWSTQLYTVACSCWAMAIARLARIAKMSHCNFINLFDGIVAAYLLTLIIQQICVAAGWPVFNPGCVYHDNPWRLNALMSEPSHTSWVLAIILFYRGYLLRQQRRTAGFDAFSTARTLAVWAAYLYVCFSVPNVSAYVWTPLALIPYLTRRNWAPLLGLCGCVLLFITVVTPFAGNKQLQRFSRLIFATPTLNLSKIEDADLSAAIRINPNIIGAQHIGVSTLDDWFGHGTDADARELPFPSRIEKKAEAGIFHVWYNYGIIAAILLWAFVVIIVYRPASPLTLIPLILALLETSHCNSQLLWVLLTIALAIVRVEE